MHGIIKPKSLQDAQSASNLRRIALAWLARHAAFLLVVIVPSFLTLAFYGLVAADQFQAEAHFVVRTAEGSPGAPSGFSQFLGLSSGSTQTRSDAMSVNDYLDSQNAVDQLRTQLQLVDRFRRPEADFISELRSATPTPEALLKYYRRQVDITFNSDSGITTLKVRAFRPRDSYAVIKQLLILGERRVNFLNQRSLNDTLANSRRQLAESEKGLAAIQRQMTDFRQQRGDIDPEGSGKAQIQLVSTLTVTLSQAKSQLAGMRGIISAASPQYVAMAAKVHALEAQVAAQSGRLIAGDSAIAARLGDYEDLQIRQQFAAKRYEAAAANLEKVRDQANKQQLYIVRIVDPIIPVKSQFPQGARITLTVFLTLLITYAIGWLIFAGMKEHSI